jgi:hypothetical protein
LRLNPKFLSYLLGVSVLLLACNQEKSTQNIKKHKQVYNGPCDCALSEKSMIELCPVDAIGDSVVICKVGTITVIDTMTVSLSWTAYIKSRFHGGEGTLVDCKTGENLLKDDYNIQLSYFDKKLVVDKKRKISVYDGVNRDWSRLDLPAYRQTIYAKNGKLYRSTDSLIFRPAPPDKKAFAQVYAEYQNFIVDKGQYGGMGTMVNKLVSTALSGDKFSISKLVTLKADFADYFDNHPEDAVGIGEDLKLYADYSNYLKGGRRVKYFDLTIFPRFKKAALGKKWEEK